MTERVTIWEDSYTVSNGEEGFKEETTTSTVEVEKVLNTSGEENTVDCYEVRFTMMIGDSAKTLERFGPNSKSMAIGYADGFITGIRR